MFKSTAPDRSPGINREAVKHRIDMYDYSMRAARYRLSVIRIRRRDKEARAHCPALIISDPAAGIPQSIPVLFRNIVSEFGAPSAFEP